MIILKCSNVLSECGIDTSTLILEHLLEHGPSSLEDLIRSLDIPKPTLCTRLRALHRLDLVWRGGISGQRVQWELSALGRIQAEHARTVVAMLASRAHVRVDAQARA